MRSLTRIGNNSLSLVLVELQPAGQVEWHGKILPRLKWGPEDVCRQGYARDIVDEASNVKTESRQIFNPAAL